MDGILVPGGFGQRGTEGKILAIGYARRNKIPYLGLCLGMQLAIVEFARNVAGLSKAASIELDPETPDPVIALMPEQNGITNLGGTLRLGAYPCVLQPETLAHKLYGKTEISERHRHRYEVNNDYREVLTKNGMVLSRTVSGRKNRGDDRIKRASVLRCNTGTPGIQIQTEPAAPAV